MTILLAAIIMGLVPAAIAQPKGKSFALWWLYGAALFVVALPHAIIIQPDMKKCRQCAELIRPDALKCRYCGTECPAAAPAMDADIIVIPRRPGADGHDRMVEEWNLRNGLFDQTRR